MPTKTQKQDTVSGLKGAFDKAQLAVVADYRGLSVAEITDLRHDGCCSDQSNAAHCLQCLYERGQRPIRNRGLDLLCEPIVPGIGLLDCNYILLHGDLLGGMFELDRG